jgi:signal transduction histidine kinase
LNRTRTDLEQVCQEVVLEIQASHSDAIVHFSSSGNVTGEWDADRLTQVVSNLIGNAIQHGGKGPVTLDIGESGDSVRLSVHNHGNPIPVESQRTIFEPLARGEPDGAQGIGLGLFIARAIVVAHRGDIRVASTGSSGTTFEVVLPRRAVGATDQDSQAS